MTPIGNDSLMAPYAPLIKRNAPFHYKNSVYQGRRCVELVTWASLTQKDKVTSRDFLKVCSLQKKKKIKI